MITTFAVSLLVMYASGCLIPSAFLPDMLRRISATLPGIQLKNMIFWQFGQSVSSFDIIILIIEGILLIIAALLAGTFKKGKLTHSLRERSKYEEKIKNLKLLRAWFSFLARYTRKKKSLWCMAAILLVIGIAAAQNADRHEIIRIGLYCANPDEMTEAVLTNLESLDDGLYRFYRSSSLDYMQEDINLRKAECGYEFPNDLESQMQAGEDGCISVYTSPSTVLTAVVNEAVYNAIFQEYAKTMLADFIASYDVVSVKTADELKALVDEHYEYEKENTPVFHVVYEDIPENFYDDQALFQIPVSRTCRTFYNADCSCRQLPVSPRRKKGTLPSSPSRRKMVCPFFV